VSDEQVGERLRELEALAGLAAGVAHDLGNILTVVIGHAELALAEAPDDAGTLADDLRVVVESAEQASALVDRLAAAGRRRAVRRPEVFDLAGLIASSAGVLRELAGPATLTCRPGDGPLHVRADPDRIEQALADLVAHARARVNDGARLALLTAATTLAHGEDDLLPAGRYAAVEITVEHGQHVAMSPGAALASASDHVAMAGGRVTAGDDGAAATSRLLLPLVPSRQG
jgi:nitrogen-specific signal transduction histidine kinase